jgi:hypothetical protein
MIKFWYWLMQYSRRKVMQHYQEEVGSDHKCQQCLRWASEVGGVADCIEEPDAPFAVTTCRYCLGQTRWFTGAPCWIYAPTEIIAPGSAGH